MFVTPIELAHSGSKPYYIVRLRAERVRALDPGIKPLPDPDQLPGHVVMPALFFKKKQTPDEKTKSTLMQIALRDATEPKLAFTPLKVSFHLRCWRAIATLLNRGGNKLSLTLAIT